MSLLKLQNGSDIRGVAMEGIKGEEVNLTEGAVTKIAYAFKSILKREKGGKLTFSIGRDSRISGAGLVKAVIKGLRNEGITIYDFGIASTPAMFMSTIDEDINADGAIMVTASHLPFNRNGLKFFTKSGGANSSDIREILEIANSIGPENYSEKGEVKKLDFISKYSQGLVESIRKATGEEKPFTNCKIIVDAGNGAGGFFVEKVLRPLGADTKGSLYLEPDGMFPNHQPNPENKKAMEDIKKAVIDSKAELGIIFDTDVDRAAIVDETGRSINRNPLVALMSAIVLEEHPKTTIVTDSITSIGLKDFIEKRGGIHHRFKRGYKNIINEAIELNGEGKEVHLAIETSGHCALKENHFLDDGAYLITKVLITFAKMKKKGNKLGDLISDLKEPLEAKEFRLKIHASNFKEYGSSILDAFTGYVEKAPGWNLELPNFEGVRVNCLEESGWCLIRMSLHDPVLAINIESDVMGGCERIEKALMSFLLDYDQLSF